MIVHNSQMMRKYMERQNKPNLIGAEIGVASGCFALEYFKRLDIDHFYLIDPYIPYIQKGHNKDLSKFKDVMKEKLKEYVEKYTLYEMTSDKAHSLIDDSSLDFVYIDGNHQFSYVLNDIKNWCNKVKPGGIIGGHDILGFGVLLPVLAYALSTFNLHNLHISLSDWWIKKR